MAQGVLVVEAKVPLLGVLVLQYQDRCINIVHLVFLVLVEEGVEPKAIPPMIE